ncbi:hypothetical protein MLD38_000324 [Melastoma candidum]|uniref:Uncharacterized protein n=1 Tax=Melastoma candidum TaxID=119954 RepID=A0ACB9SBN2_9MYRT|nr:hypothetical protein MLD38_000324 [Melastoma candidum]
MAKDIPKPKEEEEEVVLVDVTHVPPPPVEDKESVTVDVEQEEEVKVTESVSFKEETNVVSDLPDSQKKALEELRVLVREALDNRVFSNLPSKDEEKEKEKEIPKAEEESVEAVETNVVEAPPAAAAEEEEEKVETLAAVVVEEKVAEVDDDGAKTVEAIKETIVEVVPHPPAADEAEAPAEPPQEATGALPEPQTKEAEVVTDPPEEVFLWGIPLLADERSDVILLKFLRARDFKVKDAFAMIKNTVIWRKEFGIESLLEEYLGDELDKVVFMHGVDREGHPVCYNVYGEFQKKELYQNTLVDREKRQKFLKWRIQFLEKSIQKLDFGPTGICKIFQVNDLKNFPGITKKELRQATSQALQLLQDNYPEFLAKQMFVNVPWWYLALYSLISPFLTQRTKSKFVVSRSTEALFKYIAPEQVPVQYGGLSREGDQEFTTADPATIVTVKPSSTHSVEVPVTESGVIVWEVRVVGWEVSYGAEFIPSAEGSYTVIIQKPRKIGPADEAVVTGSFKMGAPGKVVLTVENQSYKKKKLLHRFRTKSHTQ